MGRSGRSGRPHADRLQSRVGAPFANSFIDAVFFQARHAQVILPRSSLPSQASHSGLLDPSTGEGLSQYGLVSDRLRTGARCRIVPLPVLLSTMIGSRSALPSPMLGLSYFTWPCL